MNFEYDKSVNILANSLSYIMLYKMNQQREKNMTQGKNFFLEGFGFLSNFRGRLTQKWGVNQLSFLGGDNPM